MKTTHELMDFAVSLDQVDGVDLDGRAGHVMLDQRKLPETMECARMERDLSGAVEFDPATGRVESVDLQGLENRYSLEFTHGFWGWARSGASTYHQESGVADSHARRLGLAHDTPVSGRVTQDGSQPAWAAAPGNGTAGGGMIESIKVILWTGRQVAVSPGTLFAHCAFLAPKAPTTDCQSDLPCLAMLASLKKFHPVQGCHRRQAAVYAASPHRK